MPKQAKAKTKTVTKPSAKPKKEAAAKPENIKNTKTQKAIELLKSEKGATVIELAKALEWKDRSAQGFISGVLRKKMKLTVNATKEEGRKGLVHRIA